MLCIEIRDTGAGSLGMGDIPDNLSVSSPIYRGKTGIILGMGGIFP